MGDGVAHRAARRKEEQVDVGIDLADNGKVYVEVRVQCLDRDVGSERAVFPFVAEGIGRKRAVSELHHENHGVEDARDGGGGEDRGPDDAVGGGEIVA